MRFTLPATRENVAHWSALAPRAGRKPATVALPGDPQRYVVHAVTLDGLDSITVDLAPYVPLPPAPLAGPRYVTPADLATRLPVEPSPAVDAAPAEASRDVDAALARRCR